MRWLPQTSSSGRGSLLEMKCLPGPTQTTAKKKPIRTVPPGKRHNQGPAQGSLLCATRLPEIRSEQHLWSTRIVELSAGLGTEERPYTRLTPRWMSQTNYNILTDGADVLAIYFA